jgi:dolichyl-phosphate-mannose-protein mannosyltransferase
MAVVVGALALLLIAVGILYLFLPAWLPYSTLRSTVEREASPFSDRVSPAVYLQVVFRARLAGAVLLVVGASALAGGRRLAPILASLRAPLGAFVQTLRNSWTTFVRTESKLHLSALAVVLLTGAVARVCVIEQPMRFDEASTFNRYVQFPFYICMSNYSAPNNHVLYTLLARLSYLVFGNEPWALRLPAFLAGIIVIAVCYAVIRGMYGRAAGLFAAAMTASSSILIEYSTNARGYTVIVASFLSMSWLAQFILRTRNTLAWVLFSILGALGLFTVPVMAYPIGAVVLWLVCASTEQGEGMVVFRGVRWAVVGIVGVAMLLYVPVCVGSGPGRLVANGFVEPRSFREFWGVLCDSLLGLWSLLNRDVPVLFRVLLAIGVCACVVLHRRGGHERASIVLCAVATCVGVSLCLRTAPPARAWLFLVPVYFGSAFAGWTLVAGVLRTRFEPSDGVLSMAASVMCVGLSLNACLSRSIVESRETGVLPDAEAVASYLESELRPDDRVVACIPSTAPLEYYLRKHGRSASCLKPNGVVGGRAFVVVNRIEGHTLEQTLASNHWPIPSPDETRFAKGYASAAIYLIERPRHP